MSRKVTVIGAGPGGYTAAMRAAQLGGEVTLIENDNVGGTCLNWGCIPTKALKATAEALVTARRLSDFGCLLDGEPQPDLAAIMARKNKIVADLTAGIRHALDHHKVRYVEGTAVLAAPNRVQVTGPDGSTTKVPGDRLILAPGSKPSSLPGLVLDGRKIISSNEALLLEEVPSEVVVVGGGVIGCEFAFILKELGAGVTVVEGLDRPVGLPSVDRDSSKTLQREIKKRKIKLHLNKTVARTEDLPGGRVRVVLGPSPFLKEIKEKDKKEISLEADLVLVSVGREYNTSGIGLEEIGIDLHPKGWIRANEKMETGVPGVYAIGDALGPEKIMLAHCASTEAFVAAENCLGGDRVMTYDQVPSGIFTFPEMADVGLTEDQARERGFDYRADTALFRDLGKAQAMGEVEGQVKIVSEAKTGRVLGVHIIGPHATDLIAEATLALKLGATVTDLASTIHVHPSLSEAIFETSLAALDRRIHGVRLGG